MSAGELPTFDHRGQGSTSPRPPLAVTDETGLRIRCPNCHHRVEVEEENLCGEIHCTTCGSQFSLVDDRDATYKAAALKAIDHFELIERLGSGSFGTVWKARDVQLDRVVAVKVPRKDQLTREELELFLREARAAAQLRHPNIVSVHEVGRNGDAVYMVSDLVRGVTLDDWLSGRRFAPREAVELCVKLADALQHAHQKGVVHRDVKPGNIMLDSAGEPFLMDFGLAKRDAGELTMTLDGRVMGTPAYMSPEQAAGSAHSADGRSDVYSLGVILFRLLTGELPFRGNTRMLVMQIIGDEPPSPRKLNPHISRDLETIVLKCLEKKPAQRFQTAAELRDELSRYLRGEPIHSRHISYAERLWRWGRRNPRIALLTASVAALLVAITAGSLFSAWQINRARNRAEAEAVRARTAEAAAVRTSRDLAVALKREEQALRKSESALVSLYTTQGLQAADRGSPGEAMLWFATAAGAAGQDLAQHRSSLVRAAAWSREAVQPLHVLHPGSGRVLHMDFHPGGRHLWAFSSGRKLSIWDLAAGKQVLEDELKKHNIRQVLWSAAGDQLTLACGDRSVHLFEFPSGKPLVSIQADAPLTAVAIDPAARLVAMAGAELKLWSRDRQEFLPASVACASPVTRLEFTPDGSGLIAACLDGRIELYATGNSQSASGEAGSLKRIASFSGTSFTQLTVPARPLPAGLTMLPADHAVAVQRGNNLVELRSCKTGAVLKQRMFTSTIFALAPSPTRPHLAVSCHLYVYLWDYELNVVTQHHCHGNSIHVAEYSPDGMNLLTGGIDSLARVWSMPSGLPLSAWVRHQDEVRLGAFHPEGEQVATAQGDGLIRVWSLPSVSRQQISLATAANDYFKLSRSGKYVAAGGWNLNRSMGSTRVVEVASGRPAGPDLICNGQLNGVAISPDESLLVTLASDVPASGKQGWEKVVWHTQPGHIDFWDWKSGGRRFPTLATSSEPVDAVFTSRGDRLAVLCAAGELLLLDGREGKVLSQLSHPGMATVGLNMPVRMAFVPGDDNRLATLGQGSGPRTPGDGLRMWDLAVGKVLWRISDPGLTGVEFSPDGKLMAIASREKYARVYDAQTGKPAGPALAHRDWVFHARFSPDGSRVATACRDMSARIWNWESGELAAAMEHKEEVYDVRFHKDPRWLITASRGNVLQWWEAATGQPLAPPQTFRVGIHQVQVTPDGLFAVAPTGVDELTVFDLSWLNKAISRPPQASEALHYAEIVSGRRVTGGGVNNLTADQWLAQWKLTAGKSPFPASPLTLEQRAAWHRREAAQAGSQDIAGSQWHLQRLLKLEPDDVDALVDRAYGLYRQRRDLDVALADLDRAIELNPQHGDARRWRAAINSSHRKDFAAALSDLEVAIERRPADGTLYSMRSYCLSNMGRDQEAAADILRYVELRPPLDLATRQNVLMTMHRRAVPLLDEADPPELSPLLAKMHELALAVVQETGDSGDMYNMACTSALLARVARTDDERQKLKTSALDWLGKAVEAGYKDLDNLQADADMEAIRSEPKFMELVERLKGLKP